jgi:moderate conductance mechanosensitive channel
MNSPTPSPTDSVGDEVAKQANALLDWFLGAPLRIILIIVIGSVVLAIVRRLINRVAEHIADGTPLTERRGMKGLKTLSESSVGNVLLRANPLANARRAQRARTIGSVLRSTANILLGTIIVLMVLTELGMNIAPFLASAGIVGVALGFGAQSLVKDFLSGTFMLLEDQYGVGDSVDFGVVSGTVEEVALRVTKVRDADGTLWYIRNGEILRTGNKSQEWGRASVEVRVAYFADLEQVERVLREAGQEVAADPVLGTYLLEQPEVSGIESMTPEEMVLKVSVKTQAAMQGEISRALRTTVRERLAAAEIPLAGAERPVVEATPPVVAPVPVPAQPVPTLGARDTPLNRDAPQNQDAAAPKDGAAQARDTAPARESAQTADGAGPRDALPDDPSQADR